MGRMIDVDKLGLTDFEIVMCSGDYKEALKMLIEKIENAPTVDAEPIVHGHWVDEGKKFLPIYCSRCGFGKVYEDQRNYAYCPNCGAKMDEANDGNHN